MQTSNRSVGTDRGGTLRFHARDVFRRFPLIAALLVVVACEPSPVAPPAVAPPEPTGAIVVDAPEAGAAPDPANLIAHWNFDQGSGTTLTNVAGTGFNGTFSGTPTWTAGRSAGALAFDGTDHVVIGDVAPITGVAQLTLTAWIKRGVANGTVLLGKQVSGGGHTVAIENWSDGKVYFGVGASSYAGGSVVLNDTNWHHVALVFDGTLTGNAQRLKGYVDGVRQTLSFEGTVPNSTTNNANAFNLGRIVGDYSNGLIDDVWLFARALTPAEIQGLAQPESQTDTSPPTVPTSLAATPVSTTQINLTWTASTDDVGVTLYRVFRNGAQVSTPSSTSFTDTGLTASTTYAYAVAAVDAAGNASAQSAPPVSATTLAPPPPDTIPPTASLTAPSNGATVSGTVAASADASDAVGVVGVQFKLDGANLGTEDTTAPYSISWNSALVSDGTHTLSARARDAAGNFADAPVVSVTTNNAPPPPSTSAFFPLSIAPDRRHLLDKNGDPFFINGDTPWELIMNVSLADAELYLADRKSKGFNAILITLVEHFFSTNPPLNANGDAPFTVEADFSTPNEAYFAHVDAVLQKALEKDFLVLITPAYLGYDGGAQGWYSEVNVNGPAKMRDFGRYLGNRYGDFPNLVWVMGGDFAPNAALDEIRAIVQGIEEAAGPQLFSVHNGRDESGVTQYQAADSWIDLNTAYAYNDVPAFLFDDYNRTWNGGPVPFVFIEGVYEYSPFQVGFRSQAYWPVLMGGVGHFYGHQPLWNFAFDTGGNWQQYLDAPTAVDMIHWKNLFGSRATHLLVPDNTHVVLTNGYGSLDETYAAAARASDGRTVMVYVPNQRALTIDMTRVSGSSAIAWWFNPDTGVATQIGTFPTTGSRNFTPPASQDWVLVIDDAAYAYGPPGGAGAPDTTPPSVSVTAPANGATVRGTISVTADASDNVGVVGVQFRLDGTALGAEDTTAPYSVSWNTTSAPNGAHTLTAVARDAAGNTTTSVGVGLTVDNAPPSVPTNLATTPVSQSQINLTWTASTDNVGVTGYRVFRNGTQVGTPATTSFSDTGLSASTTYSYTVAAVDGIGNVSGQSSPPVSATTLAPPDVTGPSVSMTAPANGAIVSGTTSVTADASDNVGVVGVQFRLDGADLGLEDTTAPYSVSWNTGSASEGGHSVTAIARDAAGNTTTAIAVVVTVDNVPDPDTSPPTVPTNPAATPASSSQIDLTWTASTDNVGVTGYRVFRNGTQVGTPSGTSFWDTGLSASTSYSYTVAAVDAAGNASAQSSPPVSATTPAAPDVTPPSVSVTAPANGATVGGTISVTGSASDNVGVVGVQFRLDGTDLGAEDTTAPYSVSWNTTSASNGAHTLTAVARDAAGNTTTSGGVGVTVDNAPPSVPTNLAATPVSSSQINLTWTASTDNVGVTGYRVFRNGTQVGTPATTSFSDTGLSTGTTYSYTVAAVDGIGNVSPQSSPPVSATTTSASGPIAAYNFNEGSGTVLLDRSGNGRNGTIQGSPVWTTGKNGLAINYDGINDNVALGNLTPLNGVTKVTVSAWMKRFASNSLVLIGKQLIGNDLAIEMWSDGRLYFQMSNGADTYGWVTLSDTNWHHVTLVYDGTLTGNAARLKAYVDGNPVTLSFSGTVPATTTSNTTPFNLGVMLGDYTKGMIDDVRIYTRVLSQAEIQADMNTPVP